MIQKSAALTGRNFILNSTSDNKFKYLFEAIKIKFKI